MVVSLCPTIVAGCYERFLFGFQAPGTGIEVQDGSPTTLNRRFTYAAHQNAVKCIASKGPFLASGGGDDQIHLYDLKHDKDLGFLINPGNGPVPCLEFFCPLNASGVASATPSHMFSGSQDGSIAIWKAGHQWEHLKLMKGHKGAINALSIHPTGRLALSTSHDSSLRMWDLSKGRCSYTSKLDMEGDCVAFSPGGARFSLTCGSKVTVHATSGEGGLLGSLQHSRRALCSLQEHEDVLLTGLEDGSIKVWDLRTSSIQGSIERAHGTRIRGLSTVASGGVGACVPQQLASASSDGVIKVWDMRMMGSGGGKSKQAGAAAANLGSGSVHAALLAQTDTHARLTCLTTVHPLGRPSKSGAAAPAATKIAAASLQARPVAGAGAEEDEEEGDNAAAAAVAAAKRMKRAAKKRARAEAKAIREAAAAAGGDGGSSEGAKLEGGAPVAQQQPQGHHHQNPSSRQGLQKGKRPRASTFGMGDDDEFEVVPAAGDSDEDGAADAGEGGRAGGSGRGRGEKRGGGRQWREGRQRGADGSGSAKGNKSSGRDKASGRHGNSSSSGSGNARSGKPGQEGVKRQQSGRGGKVRRLKGGGK